MKHISRCGANRDNVRALARGVVLLGLWGSVLLFGGRHPLGQTVLLGTAWLAAVLAVIPAIRAPRRRTSLGAGGWIFLGGTLLLLFQLVPLSPDLLRRLSPQLGQLLPAWTHSPTAATLGSWRTLSLAPDETRLALSLWLTYGLLFFATVYWIRSVDDVEKTIAWFLPLAVLLSIFGILQYLFGNEKFFWTYEHPFARTGDAVKACFTNRNHFASLVALAVGPLLWWLVPASSRTSRDPASWSGTWRRRVAANGGVLKWFAVCVVLLAVILTYSRGGTIALVLALAIGSAALYQTGYIHRAWLGGMIPVCCFLLMGIAIVGSERISDRWKKLFDLVSSCTEQENARLTVWRNTSRAARDFILTGSGGGSFAVVHPLYYTNRKNALYYTHAENGYLQILLEMGLPGAVLLLAGIATLGRWAYRACRWAPSRRERALAGLISGSLAAFIVHGVVDFVWYVPSLAALASVLAACLYRLSQIAEYPHALRKAATPTPMRAGGGQSLWPISTLAVLTLSGIWQGPMIARTFAAGIVENDWNDYLRLYRSADRLDEIPADMAKPADTTPPAATDAALSDENTAVGDTTVPTDIAANGSMATTLPNQPDGGLAHATQPSTMVGQEAGQGGASPSPVPQSMLPGAADAASLWAREERMIRLLEKVVKGAPYQAEAHLRLAKAYLRVFHITQMAGDNPMPLSQIRDAALQAPFSSSEEQREWLTRVLGPNLRLLQAARREALSAVRLCPLLGEGYFILGQLCFLEGKGEQTAFAWFRQSVLVRPCDGELLFRVGAELALMGREQEGIALWQRSAQCGRLYQRRILEQLMGRTAVQSLEQEIIFFLQMFNPDLDLLRFMYRTYQKSYPVESLGTLRQAYIEALQRELRDQNTVAAERASLWLELHFVGRDAGDLPLALHCAQQAVQVEPLNYQAHYYLALRLEDAGRYAEAEEHIRWCLQRRPGHRALLSRLRRLHEKSLATQMDSADAALAERTPFIATPAQEAVLQTGPSLRY